MIPPHYLVGTAAVTENLLKRKWSTTILRHLDSGLHDPTEICRLEPDLTLMALNERLRTMLRYSLVTRYSRYPRRGAAKLIEYRLSPRGQKILRMLTLIERLDELNDHYQITLQEDVTTPERQEPSESPTRKHLRKKAPNRNTH